MVLAERDQHVEFLDFPSGQIIRENSAVSWPVGEPVVPELDDVHIDPIAVAKIGVGEDCAMQADRLEGR